MGDLYRLKFTTLKWETICTFFFVWSILHSGPKAKLNKLLYQSSTENYLQNLNPCCRIQLIRDNATDHLLIHSYIIFHVYSH